MAAAEIVNVLLPEPGDLMLVVEKLAPSPDGCPLTDKLTAVLKVLVIDVVNDTVVFLPARIVTALLDPVSVKVAGTLMFKLTVAVFVVPPEAAVTVTGYVPALTLKDAANCTVAVPDPGAFKVAGITVTPAGNPLAETVTEALNPPLTEIVVFNEEVLPAAKLSELGALS